MVSSRFRAGRATRTRCMSEDYTRLPCKIGRSVMQVSDVAIKFFRPEAAPPFVSQYRLNPKAGILNRNPAHFHPDTIEIFSFYRGHLDWTVDGETYHLRPGDVIVIPPTVVHGAVDAHLQA